MVETGEARSPSHRHRAIASSARSEGALAREGGGLAGRCLTDRAGGAEGETRTHTGRKAQRFLSFRTDVRAGPTRPDLSLPKPAVAGFRPAPWSSLPARVALDGHKMATT